jgi:Ca-activated chloride channel homolog
VGRHDGQPPGGPDHPAAALLVASAAGTAANLAGAAGGGRGRRPFLTAVVLLALVATGVTGVVLANPDMVVDRLPGAAGATQASTCPRTEVVVAAAPEVAGAVTQVLAPALGARLADGTCLDAVVRPQEPLETLATTTVLPPDRLPAVWIPDSSLWLARVTRVTAQPVGSFATSPVVIATSRAAVGALGWGALQPTWVGALTGERAVAVPDLAQSATGLLAVLALRTSAGGGTRADQAVAATVLAAQRADAPTADAAFTAASGGAAGAPLVPAAEQAVFTANRASAAPALVAVYPKDGSPSLDYPVVRVASAARDAAQRVAVDAVVRALLAPAARDVARREGFRQPGLSGPAGSGVRSAAVSALTLPPAAQIQALLGRLATLAQPIRMLALIDISLSMRAEVSPGSSRIELVRDAAKGALQLLPDRNKVGAWVFSANLAPGVDHVELSVVEPLSVDDGGVTHRERIVGALDSLPSSLRGTGTALYATTLAAVKELLAGYDATASNVVVLLTDGTNENAPGLDQAQLLAQLKTLETAARPVRLIAVGIGPTADMGALRAIAAATPNGRAYQATDPGALQSVLFDALSSRR